MEEHDIAYQEGKTIEEVREEMGDHRRNETKNAEKFEKDKHKHKHKNNTRDDGKIRHGDHWYFKNESVSIKDRWKEESENFEIDEENIIEEAEEVIDYTDDIIRFNFDLVQGFFFSNHDSFKDALTVINKYVVIKDWFSKTTINLINVELIDLTKNSTSGYADALDDFRTYATERKANLVKNFKNPWSFFTTLMEFFVVATLEFHGKFEMLSPSVTYIAPAVIGGELLLL